MVLFVPWSSELCGESLATSVTRLSRRAVTRQEARPSAQSRRGELTKASKRRKDCMSFGEIWFSKAGREERCRVKGKFDSRKTGMRLLGTVI